MSNKKTNRRQFLKALTGLPAVVGLAAAGGTISLNSQPNDEFVITASTQPWEIRHHWALMDMKAGLITRRQYEEEWLKPA
mgnify:FL=1